MRKATESYRTYYIPSKTAALVPEFAVEHLPSAELQLRFLRCLWAVHSDDDDSLVQNGSLTSLTVCHAITL